MRRHHINEVPLAQCPKCGSEVPPDYITEDSCTGREIVVVICILIGAFCAGWGTGALICGG
jgi:hypothetical protein